AAGAVGLIGIAGGEFGRLTDGGVQVLHVGQPGPVRPSHLESLRRSDCLFFAFANHADEIMLAHELDEARHTGNRTFVDRDSRRAMRWRTHDAPMQHVRYFHVLNISERAEYFGRRIDTLHRLADDFVILRILRPHPACDFQIESRASDQLAIRDLLLGRTLDTDNTVISHELFGGDVQPFRSEIDECRTRFRGRLANWTRMRRDCPAARGHELVDRAVGVGPHEPRVLEGNVELFGHHLQKTGRAAGTEFAAAAIQRRRAVLRNADPGIDLVFRWTVRAELERGLRGCNFAAAVAREGKSHDQRAGPFQEIAACESAVDDIHGYLPPALAARLTARRILK